jgi:hypothetical protein
MTTNTSKKFSVKVENGTVSLVEFASVPASINVYTVEELTKKNEKLGKGIGLGLLSDSPFGDRAVNHANSLSEEFKNKAGRVGSFLDVSISDTTWVRSESGNTDSTLYYDRAALLGLLEMVKAMRAFLHVYNVATKPGYVVTKPSSDAEKIVDEL